MVYFPPRGYNPIPSLMLLRSGLFVSLVTTRFSEIPYFYLLVVLFLFLDLADSRFELDSTYCSSVFYMLGGFRIFDTFVTLDIEIGVGVKFGDEVKFGVGIGFDCPT